MECKTRLANWLREQGVEYEALAHTTAFTAQEIAAAQRVPGREFAKVVMVVADGRNTMLVLSANRRIDFARLRHALAAGEVRLAHEVEFAHLFPDCDVGAMPPFGNLYDVPVFVDRELAQDEDIVFQVGTHRDTFKVKFVDYLRIAHPTVAELTGAVPARNLHPR